MTEIENEKIKLISEMYDELCEEIRLVKNYSLPHSKPIETGKNYTSYKNLYLFLTKIGITDKNHIKLYLRSQFEELWKVYKFKHKVIPIGMMYNSNAVERHLNYISSIKEKYKIYNNQEKLENVLDIIVKSPLIYDSNCLSLSFDINSIYRLIINKYKESEKFTEQDFINIIIFFENNTTIDGICPGYLITKSIFSEIDSESIRYKVAKVKKEIGNRGQGYYSDILTKKNEIIERDILPQLSKYMDEIKNEILRWL